MREQGNGEQASTDNLRDAVQGLLQEDLSEQDLRLRLRALLETPGNETASGQPTTDDATDHPGYQ